MKSLKDQIEFIDKKLIVLFGFKGITDYTHLISITDSESILIDLIKLNDLIPDFRKVFHAKNFSLHKTDYKINTNIQAVCLLKTCLEVTSIPFDVSLKKNKRTLRLISKNNALEDYIYIKKMSEKGTFKNSTTPSIVFTDVSKLALEKDTEDQDQDKYLYKKVESDSDTIFTPWLKINDSNNSSQKQYEKSETITKEMLNESIKSRISYNIILGLDSKLLYQIHSMETNIVIDLKAYGLINKSISSCVVKIKSKVINGKPVISQEFIDSVITNVKYVLRIGGVTIYEDKFINGQDIILNNLIIISKCLQLHKIELTLSSINNISNYLDMLEVELDIQDVKFYIGIENKLTSRNWIIQQIIHNGLYNDLRMFAGMAGLAFTQFLLEEDYLRYKNGLPIIEEYKLKYLDEQIEKSGAKVFTGLNIPLDLTGLELDKYDEELFKSIENGYVTNKYDFITWINQYDISSDKLPYFKLILENDMYIHCWDFPITGTHDTVTGISIEIVGKEWSTFYTGEPEALNKNNNCIGVVFLDVFNMNVSEGKANADRWTWNEKANSKFNLNSLIGGSLHLITYGGIGYIRLKIHTSSPENPIKGLNINLSARFISWNICHLRKLQKQFYDTNGFVDLNKLVPEKKNYDSIKTF